MEGKQESKAKTQRRLWGHRARLVKLHPLHARYVQELLQLLGWQPLSYVCSHTHLGHPSARELKRPLLRAIFHKKLWQVVPYKRAIYMHVVTVSLVTALGTKFMHVSGKTRP